MIFMALVLTLFAGRGVDVDAHFYEYRYWYSKRGMTEVPTNRYLLHDAYMELGRPVTGPVLLTLNTAESWRRRSV